MNFEHDADEDPSAATAEALQAIATQLERIADDKSTAARITDDDLRFRTRDVDTQRDRIKKEVQKGTYLGSGRMDRREVDDE